MSRSMTARSPRPGRPGRCGAVSRKSWSAAIRAEAWTYTQRFCGVCTTVHAITLVRAVENALQLEIPVNAQLIRNIIRPHTRSRTTSCTSTTCRRSTGWTWSRRSTPTRWPPRSWPSRCRTGAQPARDEGGAAATQDLCRQRSARTVRQRLLGPSGLMKPSRRSTCSVSRTTPGTHSMCPLCQQDRRHPRRKGRTSRTSRSAG
ncbi:MAG: nickel-dependent hydrogenase large subunit [Sedimenticolaceae bacterium]